MKDILFLHGALSSKTQFDHLFPLLNHTFNTESINFSGHGGTLINPKGYSFEVFAEDILKHIDSKKIEKINLFGFGMGGYAALYFAKLYPNRVQKIFTLNVKFKWDATSTQKEMALLNAENMMLKVPSFANNLMMLQGIELWKNVLQSTSDMMLNLTKQHFLVDDDFDKINFPVLIAVGDKDISSGIEQSLEVYRKIKNAELFVLPDTDYPFEKIDTKLLCAAILRFFE